jgi:uncharacterized protein (TIGR00299 family) protein
MDLNFKKQNHTMGMLILDPSRAGISGDMLLGALLTDSKARELESLLGEFGVRVMLGQTSKKGITAAKADVSIAKDARFRDFEPMEKIVKALPITDAQKGFCLKVFHSMEHGEEHAHAHGNPHAASPGHAGDGICLEQIGSVDTLVDVVGTAISGVLDKKVYSLPVAIGLKPAAAALEIAKHAGVPLVMRDIDHELTTPTGMALIANMAEFAVPDVPMKGKIKHSAGNAEFGIPNVLSITESDAAQALMLETNVDDVDGEVLGSLFSSLDKAMDVSIIPQYGKKNRPGHLIRVLCAPENAEGLAQRLVEETGTLGVRFLPCWKLAVGRGVEQKTVKIGGKAETVDVKISANSKKIEFEDLKKLSLKRNIPIRRLRDEILKQV